MYLNNNIFRCCFIGGINIVTHEIFMKNRIVHTLCADWLYIVRSKTFRVSILGMYMTYSYMLITK